MKADGSYVRRFVGGPWGSLPPEQMPAGSAAPAERVTAPGGHVYRVDRWEPVFDAQRSTVLVYGDDWYEGS